MWKFIFGLIVGILLTTGYVLFGNLLNKDVTVKNTEEISPDVKGFLNVKINEKFTNANEVLKHAGYEMVDYLTPNFDGTYDSHWSYNNPSQVMQSWVSLTVNEKSDNIEKKLLTIRIRPKGF